MSLFDDASLVYIPTGYKATKNYSGKPSTGGADMTFSRASGATRVNSKGLVEKVRTNLLLQSNTFNTTWTQQNTTLTSGQSGYDGTSDAWKVEATTAATTRLLQSSSIAANTVVTVSAYAKVGNVDFVKFNLAVSGTNSIVTFDLTDGTIYNSNAIDTTWKEVGNGWVRISATFINSNVIIEPRIELRSDYTTDVADAGSYVYIQDAQLEYGLVATNYIETTSAAVSVGPVNDEPRLTYDPVNPTAPSLLMEPQRTNLITYSEQLDNAAWTISSATLSSNATISPSGYQDADNIITTAANSFAGPTPISISANTATYTQSIFVKWISGHESFKLRSALTGGTSVALASSFNVRTGVINSTDTTAQIVDYGNGWYRVSHQITNNGTNTNFIFQLYPSNDAVNTNTIAFWGAQVEAGSYPTSYIPTNGTSVTRVAESSYDLSASSEIGSSEGVIFIDIQTPSSISSNTAFSIGGGTSGEYAQIEIRTDLSINWRYRVGSVDYINANVGSFSAGDRLKIAFAYKNLDSILYLNGSSIATDTGTIATNAWDEVRFSNYAGTGALEANVNKAFLFPTRLDNATLATITSL